MKLRLGLLTVAALGVAVALVAGSGGNPDEQRDASYGARAERACAEARERLSRLPEPRDLRALADTSIATSAITSALADDLRRLDVPADRRVIVRRLTQALDEQARIMRQVQRSVLRDQRRAALRLVRRGASAERRVDDSARALGFDACRPPAA